MDFTGSSVSGVWASPQPVGGVVVVATMCLCTFLGKMTCPGSPVPLYSQPAAGDGVSDVQSY